MEEKYCKHCNKTKSIDKFGRRTNKKTGKISIKSLCKEYDAEKSKEYRKKYPDKVRETNNKYNKNNREIVKALNKKHFENNKERVRERARKNYKKYRQNPKFVVTQNCRNRINKLIKRKSKSQKTHKLLECTPKFLMEWLEHQFDSNMNWDNYGKYWDIEHVKPCASFNLDSIEEQKKCFSWKNIRPFESKRNQSKNDTVCLQDIFIQELKVYQYINKLKF